MKILTTIRGIFRAIKEKRVNPDVLPLYRWIVRPTNIYKVLWSIVLIITMLLITGCGPLPVKPNIGVPNPPDLSPENRQLIADSKNEILKWVIRRDGGTAKPSIDDPLGDVGDSTLFSGMLCASGDQLACQAVKNAQGSNGRWWRAPSRVDKEALNSFSRDMSLGVLLYLVVSKDTEAARRWMTYIENNKGVMCTEDSDGRCSITPDTWNVFASVWDHLGLPQNGDMRLARSLFSKARWTSEALSRPLGFQVHLVAVVLYIYQTMGFWNEDLAVAAKNLVFRQPGNPWFLYLSEGATPKVVADTLYYAPKEKPFRMEKYSFERSWAEQPWIESYGWEFVTLMNLLEKN
jgi:hypothetical protein